MTFRILWAIDSIIALAIAWFFLAGLADGSVSSFNIRLWLIILLALGAVLLGGHFLRAAGHTVLAALILAVLALPGAIYGLFFIVVIFSGTQWN